MTDQHTTDRPEEVEDPPAWSELKRAQIHHRWGRALMCVVAVPVVAALAFGVWQLGAWISKSSSKTLSPNASLTSVEHWPAGLRVVSARNIEIPSAGAPAEFHRCVVLQASDGASIQVAKDRAVAALEHHGVKPFLAGLSIDGAGPDGIRYWNGLGPNLNETQDDFAVTPADLSANNCDPSGAGQWSASGSSQVVLEVSPNEPPTSS